MQVPLASVLVAWLEEVPWWAWLAGAVVLLALAFVARYRLLVRLPLWLMIHTIYRLRVLGAENVPATGGALLVCNHVSYVDWLLLMAAHRRFIHFVIFASWTRIPGLRLLLRWAGVIPIDGSKGPRAIVQSLRLASDYLAKGKLVCIFAEGRFTRTGFLLPFHRGFEQIVKKSPAPIIPVCLDQVWGSVFSYRGGKLIWKVPDRLPYPAVVAFGAPLPATATAVDVRKVVQKLSADCSIARTTDRLPLHREFVRMAAWHPFRSCLIDPTNAKKPVYRYATVLAGAKILVKRLRPLLANDAMVGLWLPPAAGAAIANIAVSMLRKAAVNLNYTCSPEVVRSAIGQCQLKHILSSRLFAHKVKLDAGPGVEIIYLEDFRKEIGTLEWLRAFASAVLLPGWVQERVLGLTSHKITDLATVIFSSGTTGDPKGVMLTHGNIAANIESMVQAIDARMRDRVLGILPFFHSFGYAVALWTPLLIGASVVFHVDPRQAKEIGELCKKYQCTIYLTTPTFLRFCLRRCEPDDFQSVRILMCGAEKLSPALAQEFKQKFGLLPLEGYGCTELSPAAVVNVPDMERDGFRQVGNKPGTIGQPLPGVAARIVNVETGADVPPGEPGLLLICGANVMQGYLGRPEQTREVLRDGWYVTGDIAKFDEDGFITLTDRLSRFSKIGGEMVPHQKVEDVLHEILGTTDRHFVVTAVPDEAKGERLVVIHLPLNGTDIHGLWQKLGNSGMPNLWVPRERDFYVVPELPVLGTGKVDLKKVKELALEKAKG